MTTQEILEKDIKRDLETLEKDLSSPFKRAFIEGRVEGLQVALNLILFKEGKR